MSDKLIAGRLHSVIAQRHTFTKSGNLPVFFVDINTHKNCFVPL
jgi:hypothetical protein